RAAPGRAHRRRGSTSSSSAEPTKSSNAWPAMYPNRGRGSPPTPRGPDRGCTPVRLAVRPRVVANASLPSPIRIVTAGSLFDGHDASINVMRRLLQRAGAEVIHLGHNRSAAAVVDCAIAEDAHAIAITSYQGGHLEYLRYTVALLAERGADIRVFAGGGGTILPDEIEQLHRDGVARVYSPDDGRAL